MKDLPDLTELAKEETYTLSARELAGVIAGNLIAYMRSIVADGVYDTRSALDALEAAGHDDLTYVIEQSFEMINCGDIDPAHLLAHGADARTRKALDTLQLDLFKRRAERDRGE